MSTATAIKLQQQLRNARKSGEVSVAETTGGGNGSNWSQEESRALGEWFARPSKPQVEVAEIRKNEAFTSRGSIVFKREGTSEVIEPIRPKPESTIETAKHGVSKGAIEFAAKVLSTEKVAHKAVDVTKEASKAIVFDLFGKEIFFGMNFFGLGKKPEMPDPKKAEEKAKQRARNQNIREFYANLARNVVVKTKEWFTRFKPKLLEVGHKLKFGNELYADTLDSSGNLRIDLQAAYAAADSPQEAKKKQREVAVAMGTKKGGKRLAMQEFHPERAKTRFQSSVYSAPS